MRAVQTEKQPTDDSALICRASFKGHAELLKSIGNIVARRQPSQPLPEEKEKQKSSK